MNLQLLSDLHLDFHADNGADFLKSLDPKGVDLLVVAGDTGEFRYYELVRQWFKPLSEKYPRVVFVPGNHEYYQNDPTAVDSICRAIEDEFPNVTYLDGQGGIKLDGERMLYGDTLWFPDAPDNAKYADGLSDFEYIHGFVPWVYYRHQQCLTYLKSALKEGDVVVTHHGPHPGSVHPRFGRSGLNRFFVSNQYDLIHEKKPAFWLHGHTHNAFDYTVEKTRIVCNPLGYPDEAWIGQGTGFKDKLVITL